MKKNLHKIILALVTVLFAVQKVPASGPYLKSVGPPPMRFALAASLNPLIIDELKLPRLKPKPEPPMPPPAPKPVPQDAQVATPPEEVVPFPANIAPAIPNPASDVLSVTPQMINEYFKPNRRDDGSGGPNPFQSGDTIFVPAELGFVPPMPAQSRAIYTSK